jgi:hypothetical protein
MTQFLENRLGHPKTMEVPFASRHEMGWIQREKLFFGR